MQSHTYPSATTSYTFAGDLMASASSTSGGDNFTLSWDDNGNLVQKDDANDTIITNNWDNKLRSATRGPNTVSVKYDPMGNRVIKNSSVTGKRKYVVDIAGYLPTILLETDPCTGSIRKTYIYANSEILAQHEGTSRRVHGMMCYEAQKACEQNGLCRTPGCECSGYQA